MENTKREPLIFSAPQKGVGKSYYIENTYKDYFKIETGNNNRQDKSISGKISEAAKTNNKVLVKTTINYLKNKFNSNCILNSGTHITFLIEDIGVEKIFNKNRINNYKKKFDLKETEVYKLIKKINNE